MQSLKDLKIKGDLNLAPDGQKTRSNQMRITPEKVWTCPVILYRYLDDPRFHELTSGCPPKIIDKKVLILAYS